MKLKNDNLFFSIFYYLYYRAFTVYSKIEKPFGKEDNKDSSAYFVFVILFFSSMAR